MHFETVNMWDNAVCEDGVVYFSSVVLDIPAHPDTDPLLGLIQKTWVRYVRGNRRGAFRYYFCN